MKNSPNYKTNKPCNLKLSKFKTKNYFKTKLLAYKIISPHLIKIFGN